MPSLTIIRGLPGAGKSTLAHKLAAERGTTVVEPDALITSCGSYYYSRQGFEKACQAARFLLGICARLDADCIYADCLPTRQDVDDLIEFFLTWVPPNSHILTHVYTIQITPEESHARNRHMVRVDDIKEMARKWESYPDEIIHKDNTDELQ